MPITLDPSLDGKDREAAVAIARVCERIERDVAPKANIPFDPGQEDLALMRYEDLHAAARNIDLRGCPDDFRSAMEDMVAVLASAEDVVRQTVIFQRRYSGFRRRIELWRSTWFGPTRMVRTATRIIADLELHTDAVLQAATEVEQAAARHGVMGVSL
ncbi:MAG: hypothetical protein ACOC0P_02805 [Planctomycetota bacterium]